LEQAGQGSGGVPIPGGVQNTCRCGTSGHGLAGIVLLGWQLDFMILEVISNLNDSIILWFYDRSVYVSIWEWRQWCNLQKWNTGIQGFSFQLFFVGLELFPSLSLRSRKQFSNETMFQMICPKNDKILGFTPLECCSLSFSDTARWLLTSNFIP